MTAPATIGPPPAGPVPVARSRRRLAILVAAALVVAAVAATVVLLTRGPSVDDVAGRWSQRQQLLLMGMSQVLVVTGDGHFTFTVSLTSGASGVDVEPSGLFDGLLGGTGLSAGMVCGGRVEVDGDAFAFVSESGPCGVLHGTLHGKTLTLRGSGQGDGVDLFRE